MDMLTPPPFLLDTVTKSGKNRRMTYNRVSDAVLTMSIV